MLLILMLCLLLSEFGSCHNVLIIHSFSAGSHVLTLRALEESLVNKGHEITIIRYLDIHHYPPILNRNITEIILSVNNTDGQLPDVTHEEIGKHDFPFKRLWSNGLSYFAVTVDGYKTLYAYSASLLGNKELIEKLQNKEFKVCIVDILFNDAGLALSNFLGIPSVIFTNFPFGHYQFTPAFNPPSTIPESLTFLGDNMSFRERITSTLTSMLLYGLMQFQFLVTNLAIKHHLPDVPHPSILVANISGAFIMSNPAIDFSRLLPHTYLEAAGMHMRPVKPLPQSIINFIESSGDDGLILFSLGFNFDATYVPGEVFEGYFKAFSRLKQKVLVRSTSSPSIIPSNVKIMPYIPQADILAHNKTILFVSHCGKSGVMEAIKHNVPIVGIPIFGDQKENLLRLVDIGVAKALSKDSSPERIFDVIESALMNSSLKDNMIKLSKKVESFGNPLDKAIWLLEYIMDTEGADHLKLSSRHFGIIKYLCIDVLLFIMFCVAVISYTSYKSIMFIIYHFIRKGKRVKVKSS